MSEFPLTSPSPSAQPNRHSSAAALRVPEYRRFLLGQLISQLGQWAQLVAQPLLVLGLGGAGLELGLVTAFQFLPTLALGIWGGVVVDRHDKRRIIVLTQCSMFVCSLTLGILVLADAVSLLAVYLIAALTGITKVFDDPPRRGLSASLVPRAAIASAAGLNSAVIQFSRMAGPAIAAVLIATVGIGWCFMANAVSFLAVIAATLSIDRNAFPMSRLEPAKGQVRATLRNAWHDDVARPTLLLLLALATSSLNWHVVLPLFAQRTLGGDEGTYALLVTSMGIGSLAGSFLAGRGAVNVLFVGRSAVAFGAAGVALANAPTLVTACLAAVAWGACVSLILTAAQAVLQLAAAPVMQGRYMALYGVVVVGLMPVGGVVGGLLADHRGTRTSIGLGAVLAVGFGLVTVLTRRRRVSV